MAVVTASTARKRGYGQQLLRELINYCQQYYPNHPISCSAQLYLQKFYENFGLQAEGEPYNEDGIPHIFMIKK